MEAVPSVTTLFLVPMITFLALFHACFPYFLYIDTKSKNIHLFEDHTKQMLTLMGSVVVCYRNSRRRCCRFRLWSSSTFDGCKAIS